MIDLVATRASTDIHTRACARLFTATIAQAINDACIKPSPEERKKQKNLNLDAKDAIRFLFGIDSVFPFYASHVGVEAQDIRRALTNREGQYKANSGFTEFDHRTLLVRLRWSMKDVFTEVQHTPEVQIDTEEE
jgi:hypothetical protein